MRRVAIVFDNFGPYHVARLKAAGRVCELLAIEALRHSREYAWERQGGETREGLGFRWECLEDGEVEHVRESQIEKSKSQSSERQSQISNFRSEILSSRLRARLAAVLEQFQPEVAAVPGWASVVALNTAEWCMARGVPVVVMSETQENDRGRGALKEWLKRRLVRCFSAALVGGESHREYLARLGMPRDRVFLGYDAVDNEHFALGAEEVRGQTSQDRDQRSEGGIRNFLAVARFIEKKNLAGLVRAYARYRCRWNGAVSSDGGPTVDSSAAWDLVILGDGELRGELERQISELGLADCVHLLGFKQYSDLPRYYREASAFVHTSRIEPWGLVVNEAMASGLPVLVSNRCGCAPELVQQGVNGFTFDPEDEDSLSALMGRFAGPGFPLRQFGEASREIVAGWGLERFATGLSQAVEKAVREPRPPGVRSRVLLRASAWRQ